MKIDGTNCTIADMKMDETRYVIALDGDDEYVISLLGYTGIYVRAQDSTGKWRSADIFTLDKESLRHWLRSRGGHNELAEDVVCIILGHPR